MTTVANLVAAGQLVRHQAVLRGREMEHRQIYLTPGIAAWMEQTLKLAPKDRHRTLSPYLQVEQIFYEFVAGKPMHYGNEFRKLDPLGHHVWEFRPTDVRVMGYFYRRGTFLAVCADFKKNLKKKALYAPHVQAVREFMSAVALDPPPCMTEVTLNELL